MSQFEIIKRYMEFRKKASIGGASSLIKILIKISFVFIVLFLMIILIDKINFPYPNKKIEKIISNANLKIVK